MPISCPSNVRKSIAPRFCLHFFRSASKTLKCFVPSVKPDSLCLPQFSRSATHSAQIWERTQTDATIQPRRKAEAGTGEFSSEDSRAQPEQTTHQGGRERWWVRLSKAIQPDGLVRVLLCLSHMGLFQQHMV